ncbi:MAG: Ig-like domain-containing protein [Tepidanaerobacteraceae bacterium]|nr:Ig-like domain-containing protein [Tepidanaerobacteraceae bacterium]
MKRIGKILSLTILTVLLASSISFAQGLSLESIFPKDGENKLQPTNIAVKMTFSENMTSPVAQAANEDCFTIINPKGKSIKHKTLYNAEKYPNEIWIQITEPLEMETEYTLTVSSDLVSSGGNTLDEPIITHFSTRNTKQDSNGYMVIMLLMVVGMVVFTAWDTKRKLKKDVAGADEEEEKVNPYKEARKTGKTVEEIVAKTEKDKAKAEKKKARAGKRQSVKEESEVEETQEGVKRVKSPRPISAIGATTPARVIEINRAREKAKEEAEQKANSKAKGQTTTKKKGSKQQQRKKK